MESRKCPSCGAPVDLNDRNCKYCGESLPRVQEPAPPTYDPPQPTYQQPYPPQQPQYTQPAPPVYNNIPPQYSYPRSGKSKVAAGLLALFLGGLGVHKFYLGHTGVGLVYLLFCWTYIPSIIAFIEGIIYLCASDEKFETKYVRHK